MKLDLSFWTSASSKRKRIYSIIIIFILAFIVTVIGSYIPISHQDAQTISNSLNSTLNTHKSFSSRTEYIFVNNFSICLVMFIPFIGPIIGFIILGNTGVALGAISSIQGYPVWIELLSLVLTPIFWLEFAAYSTAIAEGIWLSRRLMQQRWIELKNTAILIGICAGILIVSAVIEVWLISIGV
jgi:stage II sporulation SpoM-like protein